ncbi:MAG TPA: ABC transporter permease [Acetobacteraceae bacterium]|nr:ABC transporter permease [Acetobacteraceae bacterium]
MDFFYLQALTGLSGASSLFLLAAGLTVIFGVTRVVNFAHGGLFMLGAYIGWTILTVLPSGPFWFALGVLAAALAVAALGAALEIALLRRIYRAPALFQLLATFGVLLVIEELTQRIWGPDDLSLPRPPWLRGAVPLAGGRFPAYDLALIFVGPLVLALLWALFTRTRWGTLVRAATEDREMVGALGVDQRLLFTAVFALGAGLAGLGGALTLPDQSATLQMDLPAITDAFVIVVVGGLGSVGGAWLAALLIGELQAFGIVLVPQATLVLAFVVMAAVLALRPNGLLGRPIAETRATAGLAPMIRPAPTAARALGAVALLLAALAPFWLGAYGLSILTEAAIAILFAASLHLMMGPGGMPSFGHAAFFGLGAYAAALAAQAGAGMLPGLALGLLLAAVAAALLGAFVARLAGVYLAMLTLAFAQIVWAAAFQWVQLTGGDNGLLNVWPPRWAGSPAAFFWLALVLCVGTALLLRRALYAPFGYALRAARDSPLRAEAIGLSPFALRVAAFALAGAGAGLAGGLFGFAKGGVFPSYAGIPRSVDALLMVLLGGVHAMSGPIVGALAYTILYDLLLQVTDLWRLVLGLAIIALVLAFPEGIAGAALRRWRAA